jgi:hypothetical protein
MKISAPISSRSLSGRFHSELPLPLRLILSVGCIRKLLVGLGFMVVLLGSGHAQTAAGMQIGVRSGIDPAEKAKRDQDSVYARNRAKYGQVYVLASVKEETWESKLIKPVDALAMAKEVKRQLQNQGFREAGPKEKPDIVITVRYGRGTMPDPYINPDFLPITDTRKFTASQRVGLSDDDPVNYFQVHEVFVGIDAKIAALDEEKLAIQIRAWKYPPPADPKQKAELAWMTTMYADDPDHRDLNLIMPQLLAAGAPYFNRHLDREHPIEINTALPEGHVNVGAPVVGEPFGPKPK